MPTETRLVKPGPQERTVLAADGQVLAVPADWQLLPPGDAALTRRVKASGPTWTVQEKKGRRTFTRGVWASAARIVAVQTDLLAERAKPSYQKRRQADQLRRERQEAQDGFAEIINVSFLLATAPQLVIC